MTAGQAPVRVVLIGPECTGKTSLAADLALHFDAPWSPEYARTFVEEHPRDVEYADVDAIGRGQAAVEDRAVGVARQLGSPLVVHDTDLVSTLVYSRHYYGNCPEWFASAIPGRLADLYLLHDIDVPWIEDGYQRAPPERRRELFTLFASTLNDVGARTVRIVGTWDDRRAIAVAAVESLLTRD